MSKQRAGRHFPSQATELREIATLVKSFGLPGCTTDRSVQRLKRIADEIDGKAESLGQPDDG